MAVTLGTATLKLHDLRESAETVKAEWDTWEGEAYVRKVKVYGVIKQWTLSCHEYATSWANSAAKYLEEQEALGSTLALVIDIQGTFSGADRLHSVPSTNVKVLDVTVNYEKTDSNYREFTVTVQAV